jgi:hypothetical protein
MSDSNRVTAAYQLFDDLNCCSASLNGDLRSETALPLLDEDKLRFFILNCVVALHIVENQRKKGEIVKVEVVKKKVFAATMSLILDPNRDKNEVILKKILSEFPNKSEISDEQSWLPMHFALSLIDGNKISKKDVEILHSANPLSMHQFSHKAGYTPAHLLCMQKQPDMSLVRHFCRHDPEAFLLYSKSDKCALHLAAQYSESVVLLQTILQIDPTRTNKLSNCGTPLGLLCERNPFATFFQMFTCLVEVDNSVTVIYDGAIRCIQSCTTYERSAVEDISISRGRGALMILANLLNANPDVIKYGAIDVFQCTCVNLRGDLGVAVLSLVLSKDILRVKVVTTLSKLLPIHWASQNSSLNILKLLHKAHPESICTVTGDGLNLLHLAGLHNDGRMYREYDPIKDVKAKVEYLFDGCSALMHMRDNVGDTPLHTTLIHPGRLNIEFVKCLCNLDETVVRDKCTPSDTASPKSQQLPLHLLISYKSLISGVSDQGDCFRQFLHLYPASAGIKDDHSRSPYDLAVRANLNVYFIRLLLSADPTINPVRRRDLNFAARKEGMFLAFRALSTNHKPTIWSDLRYESQDLLKYVISYL